MNIKNSNLINRTFSFFLAIILTFFAIIPNNVSYAHKAAVILPLIDATNGGYSVSVEYEDKVAHTENQNIDFGDFVEKSGAIRLFPSETDKWTTLANSFGDVTVNFGSKSKGTPLYFGFPAAINGDDATSSDMNRAGNIAQTLAKTLNTLIKTITVTYNGSTDEGQKKNIEATITASYVLDPVCNGSIGDNYASVSTGENGYTFYYCTNTAPDAKVNIDGVGEVKANDGAGNLYCYILENGKTLSDAEKDAFPNSGLIWAMKKNDKINTSGSDVSYITIFMIAQYANTRYRHNDAEVAGTATEVGSNFVVGLIVNLFEGIMWGIRGILGLYDMDELIFNRGDRGGISYEDGLMHSQWWRIVLKYFTIFQVIAWMLIALAIGKALIQINVGTISSNSTQRAQLMDTLIKLVTVGLLLTLCIPIVRLFVQVNNALVNVFASAYTGNMAKVPATSNPIVTICLMFFYFAMTFYTNFTYIMRSITLAILIASAPLFIVTMAFSKKNLFDNWLKEVAANIFLQAFHAFAFSFLFEVIASGGKTIESIAVIFSIYPLTDWFRTMIFGNAGGNTVSMGKALGNAAKNMTSSALGAAGNMALQGASGFALKAAGGSQGTAAGQAAEAAIKGGAVGNGGGMNGRSSGGSGVGVNTAKATATALKENADMAKGANLQGARLISGFAKAASVGASAVGGISSIANNLSGVMEGLATGNQALTTQSASALGRDAVSSAGESLGGIKSAAISKFTGGQMNSFGDIAQKGLSRRNESINNLSMNAQGIKAAGYGDSANNVVSRESADIGLYGVSKYGDSDAASDLATQHETSLRETRKARYQG